MKSRDQKRMCQPIEDSALTNALNELSRTANIIATYGKNHPATRKTGETTFAAMQALFANRPQIVLGNFSGILTIDGDLIQASGTLLKSLERRLSRLQITGLRISKGTSAQELEQLAELLSHTEAADYANAIKDSALDHIALEDISFQAVREGQTVANTSDLAGMDAGGVLVLDDDAGGSAGPTANTVQVDQIVAFLKGDISIEDGNTGEELAHAATDPETLGQMIMESVAIRQSASQLTGESVSDIVLGCLRRTFDGLRTQPSFQTSDGIASLQKSLLLLEESMLEKMRNLAGDACPELDRQIVQAVREMDETLGFELAARQYAEHRQAIKQNKEQLQAYLKTHAPEAAEELLQDSGLSETDWQNIVVGSNSAKHGTGGPDIAGGLNTLATVFEKLETLMQSEDRTEHQVHDLVEQANENIGDTFDSTREKLDTLSKQLKEEDTGTIGGEGRTMSRKELLSSISEVAQELKQPLTAINASLEMMLDGYVGEVSNEQRELIDLAHNSSQHLRYLMNQLINIVGLPANKGIDERFHTTSEQVVLMKGNSREQ